MASNAICARYNLLSTSHAIADGNKGILSCRIPSHKKFSASSLNRRIQNKRVTPLCSAVDADAENQTVDVVAKVASSRKVLVLGGNGFVGSAVCKQAVTQGLEVVSLNRSGAPPSSETWVEDVKWIKGDVFNTDWDVLLADISGIISCIGGFGTNDVMERINGDATIAAINAASKSGVETFVFVSVHDYNLPSFALNNGYFNGKRRAEAQLLTKFPSTGVILRPGFIYGKRRVNNFELPLDFVGKPLEAVLKASENLTKPLEKLPASDLLLAPPVNVDDVAAAAVYAVTSNSLSGIIDIDKIKEIAKGE